MTYTLYRVLLSLAFLLLAPLALPLSLTRTYWRQGLRQRLGSCLPPRPRVQQGGALLWLHAASVGEVRAAAVLVRALNGLHPGLAFIVSTTSVRGGRLARELLPQASACFLAPLDLPWVVGRTLRHLRPDLYICLETELWPVMLRMAANQGIPTALLNARLSERSLGRYRLLAGFMRQVLRQFRVIVAAGPGNGRRFLALGASPARLRVEGNLKYEPLTDGRERGEEYRARLAVSPDVPFLLCGSTHAGEEEILLDVASRLRCECGRDWLLMLAPRHLERLRAVEGMCARKGVGYELFSRLTPGGRRHSLVVLDTMGELADLYGVADHVFCGGSLVAKGGHNPLEAARWGLPVHFGPHMEDFREEADLLEEAGAGFTVADGADLARRILHHERDPEAYRAARARALEVTVSLRGSAVRQACCALELLDHGKRYTPAGENSTGEN